MGERVEGQGLEQEHEHSCIKLHHVRRFKVIHDNAPPFSVSGFIPAGQSYSTIITYLCKGGETVGKVQVTEFGKSIKKRLVDLDRSQEWLMRQIREQTNLYIDSSYMYKILTGRLATPKIVAAIREILDLPEQINSNESTVQ